MPLLQQIKPKTSVKNYEYRKVLLKDGQSTTLHISRYRRGTVHPRVVLFKTETNLLEWCQNNDVQDAVTGGFFLRSDSKPVGEVWIDGMKQDAVPL